MMSKKFIAVATDTNILNLVALMALANPQDKLLILQDKDASIRHLGERLKHEMHQKLVGVQLHQLPDRSIQAFRTAVESTTQPSFGKVVFLNIGGRKRESLLIYHVLKKQASLYGLKLRVITIGDSPPSIESLEFDPSTEALTETIRPLSSVESRRTLTLDQIVRLHGFERNPHKPGNLIRNQADVDRVSLLVNDVNPANARGEQFEVLALRKLQQNLKSVLGNAFSELYFNVGIREAGANTAATDFDLLVLMRDGRAVYFECKSGSSGGRKDLQARTSILRSAFTPRSAMVLCKGAGNDPANLHNQLKRSFQNIGRFGVWLIDDRRPAQWHIEGLRRALREAGVALE